MKMWWKKQKNIDENEQWNYDSKHVSNCVQCGNTIYEDYEWKYINVSKFKRNITTRKSAIRRTCICFF